jgi:putative FmdB family regulatory protein
MPYYEYDCQKCGHHLEECRTYEEGPRPRCPVCQAREPEFHQDFSGRTVWVYGNPTTVGQQAEANARKLGKEQLQKKAEAARAEQPRFTGKLPEGASINTTGTGETPWWRTGSVPGVPKLDKPLNLKKIKNKRAYVEKGEMK